MSRGLARRVREKRALWLTQMPADDIASMHHADLQGAFAPQGLDLVETRAVFAAVPREFTNAADGKKAMWRKALRERLEAMTRRTLAPHDSAGTPWKVRDLRRSRHLLDIGSHSRQQQHQYRHCLCHRSSH